MRRAPDDREGSSPRPFRICLVAHFAYGALSGEPGHIGGVERQTALMARWLAARGHDVSILTWAEGQRDGAVIDRVRVLTLCAATDGIPGLRFVHPRWTSLVKGLRRADADVYYQNCGEYVTGQVAMWCRANRRRFVYSVASTPDCDPALPLMHTMRERLLYRFGVTHADGVIVQTREQQGMLTRGFATSSIVVPMPCVDGGIRWPEAIGRREHRGRRVLWLGRVCRVKRPDRLLALAQRCPEVQFEMVGPLDGEYGQDIAARAALLPNLTVHGPAAPDQVHRFYRDAACLCCTSDVEGFPNTFIEAWSHGVPIVTTIDPDGVITRERLGALAGTADLVDGLAAGIAGVLADSDAWMRTAARARAYYEANHTVDGVMRRFEQVFDQVRDQAPLRRAAATSVA